MAPGELTPLAPLGPSEVSDASRAAPAAPATTAAPPLPAPPPPPPVSAEAGATAILAAREQRVIECRKQATAGQMYALLTYLIALTLFALYSLFSFWPRPTPNEQIPRGPDSAATSAALPATALRTDTTGAKPESGATAAVPGPGPVTRSARAADSVAIDACDARQVADLLSQVRGDSLRSQLISVCYFNRPRIIWKETQAVLVVLFGGGIGALLSCLRRSTLHFFKGDLCAEGMPGLYVWPFSGALTALVFYVFIRGGFFSGQSTIAQTSPYSFIALAMLAGMFMHEVVAKLHQIAETILTPVSSRPTVPAGTPGAAPGTGGASAAREDGNEAGGLDEAQKGPSQSPASPPGTVG